MDDLISRESVKEILNSNALPYHVVPYVWDAINQLPSAQSEIIYCGDCKYKDDGIDEDGIPFLKCLHGKSYGGTRINDFCSWAERREDG